LNSHRAATSRRTNHRIADHISTALVDRDEVTYGVRA
jgi:hypothetical protein